MADVLPATELLYATDASAARSTATSSPSTNPRTPSRSGPPPSYRRRPASRHRNAPPVELVGQVARRIEDERGLPPGRAARELLGDERVAADQILGPDGRCPARAGAAQLLFAAAQLRDALAGLSVNGSFAGKLPGVRSTMAAWSRMSSCAG
jgi:hypothetical protein